jgi:hypothetical protein
MKRVVKLGGSAILATMWPRLIAVIAGPVVAIAYGRAAQRDEGNGFEFTAAMRWRKAAHLMASVPLASDLCWKQWERIMRLPRRLAVPIGTEVAEQNHPIMHPPTQPAPGIVRQRAATQVGLASAA